MFRRSGRTAGQWTRSGNVLLNQIHVPRHRLHLIDCRYGIDLICAIRVKQWMRMFDSTRASPTLPSFFMLSPAPHWRPCWAPSLRSPSRPDPPGRAGLRRGSRLNAFFSMPGCRRIFWRTRDPRSIMHRGNKQACDVANRACALSLTLPKTSKRHDTCDQPSGSKHANCRAASEP